ncbi:MAG TPA: cellulase family glycosylhydrolase [Tepidisphaeraceae bacterium]|jgi:hypothetical protein
MKSYAIAAVLLFLCSWARAQDESKWVIELTREAGAVLRYDGATVVSSKYIAWGPSWKFAPVKTAIGRNEQESWDISGEIPLLNLDLDGRIKREGDQFTFTWNSKINKASRGNIGGGLSFDIRVDEQVFGPNVPEPVILNDGRGWSWTPVPGQTVKFTFDKAGEGAVPEKTVFFDRGKTNEIRAMFIPGTLAAGTESIRMTIELPPGTKRTDSSAKRYGEPDDKTWLAGTVDWAASPVDLSYLNDAPAGKRGFVKADGDRFVYGDGTEARFWGCNIQAYALFDATDEAIELQAKRIAMLGFNLVRIHHHDSAEWSPSVFSKSEKSTQVLDEKNLDRIDYWIKCLKDNGIYVWLDLHTGRPFREGDNITGFDEFNEGKTGRQAKGFNYINPDVTQRMKEFAAAYLTRTNRYTKLRYVDEPAVMGVLLTNENDITHHFGNNWLPNKDKPLHQQMYEVRRNKIVKERDLNASEAWKNWLAGPSKVVLNEVEYQWNRDFIEHLRGLGLKVPIATTNTWGSNPLFSLPALTAGDMIDVHSYGQAESLSSNPKYSPMSSHWLAAAQVKGMPLTITEWNTEFPQRDRFTQPLFIAATAAFQGWDAPMIYGYQQSPMRAPTKLESWSISNDPSHLALMPAAALIFRQGYVKPAEKTVVFSPPGNDLLLKEITPVTSPALRTLSERHRLVIGLPKTPLLPWLKGVDRADEHDVMKIAPGADGEVITSDTGELARNHEKGLYTINTPTAQAAMGWMEGEAVKLADVEFKIDTPKASVSVVSLDGQPIATSKKMLLSFVARSQMVGKPAAIKTEPIIGEIRFPAPVTFTPINGKGHRMAVIPDQSTLKLNGRLATHWVLVTRP